MTNPTLSLANNEQELHLDTDDCITYLGEENEYLKERVRDLENKVGDILSDLERGRFR